MGRISSTGALVFALLYGSAGCGEAATEGEPRDPAPGDAGTPNADAGFFGSGGPDAGTPVPGSDGGVDGGVGDAGAPDGGDIDAGGPPPPRFDGCDGDTSAHQVFTEFWQFFDREYALFDIRLPDTDWYTLGEQGCDRIDASVEATGAFSERQLFTLMVEMAERLDDGHVFIDAFSLDDSDDGWVNEYPNYDALYELEGNVEFEYIDEDEFTIDAYEEFSWGTIGNVGYISITSLSDLSPLADPDATDQDDHTIEEQAADAAMARFIGDMTTEGVDSIIVDIRANEGGWDTVALVVARWFAGDRTVAWSEQRRNGPGHLDFGPFEDTYVEDAQPDAFTGPVVLLTSGGTFSAAEVMMLVMGVRDNVTIMGERTSGHLSDQLLTTLSNGWEIDLSNERYRAADGNIYEAVGVPVDIPVSLDVAALDDGTDTMLEAALAQLGQPWEG